jgi:hypothetical protein
MFGWYLRVKSYNQGVLQLIKRRLNEIYLCCCVMNYKATIIVF